MQLIVLGMHRSGTSVISGILNLIGVYFGFEDIMIESKNKLENPKGFWEREDILNQNVQLLQVNNYKWNKVSGFDVRKLSESSAINYQEKISDIIKDLDAHRPWFVKDPRFCLLFPLWKTLLKIPICIHVIRNPLEVAKSLEKRNAIPILTAIALWEFYNVKALESSKECTRIIVSYNDLMLNSEYFIERLLANLSNLGVKGLRQPSKQEIFSFVDVSLYRNMDRDNRHRDILNKSQKKLYADLLDGSAINDNYRYCVSNSSLAALRKYEANLLK